MPWLRTGRRTPRAMQRVHVDANIILRFLRNDDPKQSPLAAQLFQQAQAGAFLLLVSQVILMEVVYVLSRTYGIERPRVAQLLRALLASGSVDCEDGGVAMDALAHITSNQISFGDAILAAQSIRADESVATFDRGLARHPGVKVIDMATLQAGGGS